jgi:hypothetical protein
MAPNRMNAPWLRPVLALFAFAGLLALGGCGGGSGAPNNPFAPGPPVIGPLFVLPTAATVYSHTPATLTVSGGKTPYQAFSSNSAILPVAQQVNGATIVLLPGDVATDTVTTITVQDAIGQTATSTITVRAAPIFGTLTITPDRTTCGTSAVCSGDTATATVQVTGPGGAGIPNRAVRFDVVAGAFAIQTTNPATPYVSTLTVVSDARGNASVILFAGVNAPTQPAMLRVTEVTTGNSVTGVFTIVQQTDGTAILSVVPSTATVTGPLTTLCSSGFRIDYYIYGGTPPYQVASTQPGAVTLVNSTVLASGGFFEVITNGTCTNPLVFTIVDKTGRQVTAQLINALGTIAPPTPPVAPALVVTPSGATATACGGKTFPFVISGGTAPFSVTTVAPGVVTTSPVTTSPGSFFVSGFPSAPTGTYPVAIADSSTPQQSKVVTITCN